MFTTWNTTKCPNLCVNSFCKVQLLKAKHNPLKLVLGEKVNVFLYNLNPLWHVFKVNVEALKKEQATVVFTIILRNLSLLSTATANVGSVRPSFLPSFGKISCSEKGSGWLWVPARHAAFIMNQPPLLKLRKLFNGLAVTGVSVST